MVSVGVLLYRNGSREEAHEHWDRALESATIWVLVSTRPYSPLKATSSGREVFSPRLRP